MTARASKISLIVFVVLLVLSAFLMSIEGDYWPWYVVMSVFALVPLVVGPRRYRIMGAIALLMSGALIVSDIAAGRRFHSHKEKLSDQPAQAAAQIQGWVPIGTSQIVAQRIMEQHHFTCSMKTNSSLGDLNSVDFLYCDYSASAGWPVQRRWQVALVLTNSTVSEVRVSTGLVGP